MVNFDYPSSSEDYVHRIGRTGRCDRTGTAYTFFTSNNAKQANELIAVLKEAKQEVTPRLFELASQSHRYGRNVRSRYGSSFGGRYGSGGGGGYGGNRSYGGGSSYSNGASNGFGGGGFKRKFEDAGAAW